MAVRDIYGHVEAWTNGYAFERTAWAVRDGSGDGIEDKYVNLNTNQETSDPTAARTLFGGVIAAGDTVQIEANTSSWKRSQRNLLSKQVRFYAPPSRGQNNRILATDPASDRFGWGFSSGGNSGRVAGRFSLYNVRYDPEGDIRHNCTSISGEPFDSENRYERLDYVDVCQQGGYNLRTKGGDSPGKWIERSQQHAGLTVDGCALGGSAVEHCFYLTQSRGPLRFRRFRVHYLGRTVTQILSRSSEEDGVPGRGTVIHEDNIVQDACFDQDSGCYSLRARHLDPVEYRKCYVSLGNDELAFKPGKSYRQAWQLNMAETGIYPREDGFIPWVKLDGCLFYTGAQVDTDSETVQLYGGCKEWWFRRTVATGWNRDTVMNLVLWDNGEDSSTNPNYGQPVVDRVYFDVRSTVIGKVRISPDPGVTYVYRDDDANGAGYRAMLADPAIVNDPRFIIFDSDDEGGGGPADRYYSGDYRSDSLWAGSVDMRKPTAGGVGEEPPPPELFFSGQFLAGVPTFTRQSLAITIPSGLTSGFISQPAWSGSMVIVGGGGTQQLNFSGTFRTGVPIYTGSLNSLSLTTAQFAGSSTWSGDFSIQQPGGGDDDAETFDDATANTLANLLPVGPAWNAKHCPGTAMHDLTEAWGEFLDEIYAQVRELRKERFPRRAVNMLTEWLIELGLPRACQANWSSLPEKQRALAQGLWALYGAGGSSPAKLKEVLALFGYDVEIERSIPYRVTECGVAVCGDELSVGDESAFFRITVDAELELAECGVAECGDPLGSLNTENLECMVQELKPAHTKFLIVANCDAWDNTADWLNDQEWSHC